MRFRYPARRRRTLTHLSPDPHLCETAVYGWPALRRDLVDEGGLTENELGAVFTCGAWSVQGGRFLVGIARDKYGTKITVCVCLSLVLCGSVLVASSASDNLAGMCFGMLFLGMGSGAQLCVQPVAGLFPEATSTAMASLSGAFQLSCLVFLACSVVAGAGAGRFGAMGHAGVVAVLFVFSMKALPLGVSFDEEKEDAKPDAERERESRDEKKEKKDEDEAVDATVDATRALTPTPRHFGASRGALLTCDEFLCLVLWFSVMVTPSQYYVLSVGYQLERKGDANGAYSRAFTLLYGFSAPLAPLAGVCADYLGVAFAQCMATSLSLVGYAILFVDEPLSFQYVGMASYSRAHVFVCHLSQTSGGDWYAASRRSGGRRDARVRGAVHAAVPHVPGGAGIKNKPRRHERRVRRVRGGVPAVLRVARRARAKRAATRRRASSARRRKRGVDVG